MDKESEDKHPYSHGREKVKDPDMLDTPVRGAVGSHDEWVTSKCL
jgi:hypothetical protein